jgi:hypothetical protein
MFVSFGCCVSATGRFFGRGSPTDRGVPASAIKRNLISLHLTRNR